MGGGNQVEYTPVAWYSGPDGFTFKANDGGIAPDGGDSNTATIDIGIGMTFELVYNFPLDSDPGWSTEGAWAFGQPTGGGTHGLDPTSGHTGDNVYGYNLDGDYTDEMPAYHLTTTALDCTDLVDVELRFWRWLGVESSTYDHASVSLSTNGTDWNVIWDHDTSSVSETSWSQHTYDLSAYADHESTLFIRWTMGTTDVSVTYPGWNIDDIEIWGTTMSQGGLPGDVDGDCDVDFDDLNELLASYGLSMGDPGYNPDADLDGNDTVDFDDLNFLLAFYNQVCS